GCAHHAPNPDEGAELYARAAVQDQGGDREGALASLTRLADLCWTHPPRERDFPGIAGEARFHDLVARVEAREPKVHRAAAARTLHVPDMIPEGIAWDDQTRRLFVGSLYRREIVVVEPDGRSHQFAGPESGLFAVVGLRVDEPRGLLWAASNGTRSMVGTRPEDVGRTELFAFDLRSGQLKQRFRLTAADRHFLNDLVVGADGAVYVTDSESSALWRVPVEGGTFSEVAHFAHHPNGIATDGRQLFVADEVAIRTVPLGGG